jgi:hypothetical protein
MFRDKKILAGGAVLFAAAFWFYIKPNYMDPKPAPVYTAEQIAAAPRPTVFIGKAAGHGGKATNAPDGIVLNLKPTGTTQRYVKIVMALEFEQQVPPWVGLSGAALDAKNAAFAEELSHDMHKILDAIAYVIGSHTAEEVSTVEGKEKLKEELIEAINHHLHGHKVEHIYFETFIVQ